MSGSGNKRKGTRIEREIAERLTTAGVPSRRVVMSGAAARYDARLQGDVHVGLLPDDKHMWTAEVKARKDGKGFVQLERWMGDCDLLFVRRNHKSPMVVVEWEHFLDMLRARYEEEKEESSE